MSGCLLRSIGWSFVLGAVIDLTVDIIGKQVSWDTFFYVAISLVLGGGILWIDRWRSSL